MTYYAKQMKDGEIAALHTMDRPFPADSMFVPVTAEEYAALLAAWEAEPPDPEPGEEQEYTTYAALAEVIREGVNSIDQ